MVLLSLQSYNEWNGLLQQFKTAPLKYLLLNLIITNQSIMENCLSLRTGSVCIIHD
jgi:hypothetical protein